MKNTETITKKEIESREDIALLVEKFYFKVLSNKHLGGFFAEAVKNWDFHKVRFVDYWSKHVLFTETFEGTPLKGHVKVDNHFDNTFEPAHFELWISLFEDTVDEYFYGKKADLAKEASKKMAKNIYLKMFVGRKPESLNFKDS